MSDIIKYWLKLSIYSVVFFYCTHFFGQKKVEFGKIGIEDFNDDYKDVFPSANAVVLYRFVDDEIGKDIVVHERIKIINELGYDVANVTIPYGEVINVEGMTYNLVKGEIVATKLDKRLQGTNTRIKIANLRKFTMPRVQAGSIIEYRYKASKGTFSDIYLQYDIPIKNIQIILRNGSSYTLSFIQNSKALLELNFKQKNARTTVIKAQDIPSFKKEDYVDNLESYRSKIEIKKTGIIGGKSLDSFRNIVDFLIDLERFTKGYIPDASYKDGLLGMIGDEKDEYKIAERVFNYIKSNFKWNGNYSIIPRHKSSKSTFQEKNGNVADINLLFVAMLKTLGIESSPILVSTKSNGVPVTPSLESFNYVVAGAMINYKQYIFDVSNPKSNFNFLPEEVLNWKGLMINDNRSFSWVNLVKTPVSKINSIVNVSIHEDLTVNGEVQEQLSGYYAINLESYFTNNDLDLKIDEVIDVGAEEYIVSEFKLKKHDTLLDKIVWNYKFEKEDEVEKINEKIYISPLFHFSLTESPFFNQGRKYPINFGFPKRVKKIITIKIPSNYKIESLPSPIKINLPEEMGSFVYNIKEVGNTIQVVTEFIVGQGEIPSDKYLELKEFFKLRVEKENEKIVLVKS